MDSLAVNVGAYLGRRYPHPACWPMLGDVLRTEFGLDVPPLKGASSSVRDSAKAFREHLEVTARAFGFRPIDAPCEGALVFMGKGKLGIFHCGIYCGGQVLHPIGDLVFLQDLFSLRSEYPLMQFWSRAKAV